ncbi:MAG: glycosyltransferase family 4 protein [Bacteroidetes bacterium]|nr:glycosyltransferase family 4 protein [Bacteroidota bacterium]
MPNEIRVAIDIRDLRISKTGAKTYLEEIVKELSKGKEGFRFFFINPWIPPFKSKNKLFKVIEHIRFFTWKQISLPLICALKKCDILFCTDYFVPWCKFNCKTAVVFHDAFFWEYPEQYNPLWLQMLNRIGVAAAKKADAIITVTEYSKKQITRFTDIPATKIFPIHLAPKTLEPLRSTTGTAKQPARKYILHVGVMEKRKNLLTLIRAFDLLLKEGYAEYDLVLVGSSIDKELIDDSKNILKLIQESQLQDRVILPGFVTPDELAAYYQNAVVYAFVSTNEGFGIPLLEAFQNHLPALIANNSCLPEVGRDAVIQCDPFDAFDIKEKLKLIIDNPDLQQEMIKKGKNRLCLFSWKITAEKILSVFQQIHAN